VQINITARHGHLSEATRAKLIAKFEKLPRFFERLTAIEVTVDLEHKDAPTVDVVVSAEHKHDILANETAADLMAAVDTVLHKLERQLTKYKEKVQDHHRTPGLREQSAPTEVETEPEAPAS